MYHDQGVTSFELGLYYPPRSLKTRLCIRGRELLYDHCEKNQVPFRKVGKLVVATEKQQAYIQGLHAKAQKLEWPSSFTSAPERPALPTQLISGSEARRMEPELSEDITGALWCPETGIVDSHSLMESLEKDIIDSDSADLVYSTRVVRVDPFTDDNAPSPDPDGAKRGWVVQTVTGNEAGSIFARTVINATGLSAPMMVNSLLPEAKRIPLYYARGSYAKYHGPGITGVSHLIYPCPETEGHGFQSLGTHLTLSLDGQVKFGPDIQWISPNDHEDSDFWRRHLVPNASRLREMHSAVAKYLPRVKLDGFEPDYVGIRPKLVGASGGFQDFVFRIDFPDTEAESAGRSLISLLGIESPGLTASLAIAEHIARGEVVGSHALIFGAAVLYGLYAPLVPVKFSVQGYKKSQRAIPEEPGRRGSGAIIRVSLGALDEMTVVDELARNRPSDGDLSHAVDTAEVALKGRHEDGASPSVTTAFTFYLILPSTHRILAPPSRPSYLPPRSLYIRMRTTSPLRLVVAAPVLLLLWPLSGQAQVNVTFDDTDPAISYFGPEGAWNASTVVCAACDNPPVSLAQRSTYHKGAYVLPPPQSPGDGEGGGNGGGPHKPGDSSSSSSIGGDILQFASTKLSTPVVATSVPTSPPSGPKGPPAVPTTSTPSSPTGSNDGGGGKGKSGGKGPGPASGSGSHGSDDSGSRSIAEDAPAIRQDTSEKPSSPVSAQFYFNGTGVYVFCIQPLGISAPTTLVNTTFFVDGTQLDTFIPQDSAAESATFSGFAPNIIAFAHTGLDDGPHMLTLYLAPNSVFILDAVVVTQNRTETVADTSPVVSSAISSATSNPSSSSKKDRASFGGVVGGILGVLGTLGFGTAFSIYFRRRRAAARDRREREASSQLPSPEMREFTPRYFPGTIVPVTGLTLPPYAPSNSSYSRVESEDRESRERSRGTPERGYADIPPPLDDLEMAPPAFGDALASPVVVEARTTEEHAER
ncbi:FAD dependent oxidoreductase-domain-containing protein [Mycena amicta]|nr:FAD dependent oxidoreductase-domain-containing protein [Mycena amicta]